MEQAIKSSGLAPTLKCVGLRTAIVMAWGYALCFAFGVITNLMPGHDTLYSPLTLNRLKSFAPFANEWGLYGLGFGVVFGPMAAFATRKCPLKKFLVFTGVFSLGGGILFMMILPPFVAGLGFWYGILCLLIDEKRARQRNDEKLPLEGALKQ